MNGQPTKRYCLGFFFLEDHATVGIPREISIRPLVGISALA